MTKLPLPELVNRTSSGVSFITDDALYSATGIRIAFTQRHGGVSVAPYASLNLATHVDDDLNAVRENRRLLLNALDAPCDCELVTLNQVHGINVIVDGPDLIDADAIVVSKPDIAALLCFADCIPLVFATNVGVYAVSHAGWRGVYNEIAEETIFKIHEVVPGIDVSDINVYIGPHICAQCFEVSEELAQRFADKFGPPVVPDAFHVNLLKALEKTLSDAGISQERICTSGNCTVCDNVDFFSYRAEGGVCGRHGAVAFRRNNANF